jgi:exonuclease III
MGLTLTVSLFFKSLRDILKSCQDVPVICAGDWNATYSTDVGENNIDIINMSNPPSITRSRWLADIYDEFNLSDPFRAMHYDKKDFTYVPRSGGQNRSRLDFFLISDRLLSICNNISFTQY